ncbi:MAG: hypothetical protein WCV93_04605 [Candidatus Shapirobacteria bacterium]
MIPIFWTTVLFAFVPPVMKLAWYKLPLIVIVLFVCLVLSLRIKGRVVLSWLLILWRFNVRPMYFIFNKNDNYLRDIEIPIMEKKRKLVTVNSARPVDRKENELAQVESVKFLHVINNQKNSLSFKLGKQGGLHVALKQIKK